MKLAKCKELLKKLGSGLRITSDSRLLKSLPNIARKKFVGKQVYNKNTGCYGYIVAVKSERDTVMYVIDWTTRGHLGGFPKIVQEQYDTLDDFVVLDR